MKGAVRFRLIPAIDRSNRFRSWAATGWGKWVALTILGSILALIRVSWWREATVLLAFITFLPSFRRWWVLLGAFWWMFRFSPSIHRVQSILGTLEGGGSRISRPWMIAMAVGVLTLSWFFFHLTRRGVLKHPVTTLLLFTLWLFVSVSLLPAGSPAWIVLWTFLLIWGHYFWYVAYSLDNALRSESTPFLTQLGYFHPFWGQLGGISVVPTPKGATNLTRIECRTEEELAIARLKGIKLVLWGAVVWLGLLLLDHLITGAKTRLDFFYPWSATFHLPALPSAITRLQRGENLSPWLCWGVLLWFFFKKLLLLTWGGAIIVAVCRMAGFNALRVTYRAFESRTFVEFWNRYNFYFKELLVDLFFYPVFVRYFKGRPKLRLFMATLAAATFGNCLFHLLFDLHNVMKFGLARSLVSFGSYLFFATLLGITIGVSQLRAERHRELLSSGWFRRNVLCRINVLGVSALLEIFGTWDPNFALTDYFRFFFALFGVRC
ncbi:MAG: hypothetical protein V1495_08310 [Pseudomonadota bacterium]